MNNKIAVFLGVFLCGLLMTSCIQVQQVEVEAIQKMKVKKVGKEGLDIELMVRIHNPNNLKIKIQQAKMDAYVNKVWLGEAKLMNKASLPKMSSDVYHFKVRTKLGRLLRAGLPIVGGSLTGTPATFRAKGFVKGKALGISKKSRLEFDKELDLLPAVVEVVKVIDGL